MYNALILGVAKERMARALSLFYAAFNTGWVAGGFIGGIMAGRLGLNAPLFGLSAIALLLALFIERNMTNPHPGPPPRGEGVGVLGLLRIPGFGAAVVAVLANLWMFGAVFNTLTPLFARDILHLSTTGIGLLYAIALAAEFLVYYPAGTWADSYGRRVVLIPSFAFVVASTVVLGFAPNLLVFAVLFAIAGLASGFSGVPPAAVLADVLPPGQSARGVATFRFGADVGYTLGPLVAGLTAASFGFKAAFIAAAIPCVLALAALTVAPETLRRQTS
jgi:MFS family permease